MVIENKKIRFGTVGIFLTVCLIFFPACSLSSEETSNLDTQNETENSEPVSGLTTVSEVLSNGRTLWYVASAENVAKDKPFSYLLVFEGGEVTFYANGHTPYSGATIKGLTFGDLDTLSDDEIIEKMTEIDKAYFYGAIDKLNDVGEDYETGQYRAPEPFGYTLSIETDSSGNRSVSEKLKFKHWDTPYSPNAPKVFDSIETSFSKEIIAAVPTHTIYNTNFSGYAFEGSSVNEVFLTKIFSNKYEFELDQPGAEGVEIK